MAILNESAGEDHNVDLLLLIICLCLVCAITTPIEINISALNIA